MIPIGVYKGPGNVNAVNSFSNWLGGSNTYVGYVTDYVGFNSGWDADFKSNLSWLLNAWGSTSGTPSRRLVLGLPMLEKGYDGQFSQIVDGAFDSYFISIGTQLVKYHLGNSIIRLGYEANNPTIGPWQATDNPGGYVAAFRHIVSVLRKVPGQSFVFDWNPTSGLTPNKPLNSFASFYPGDDVVDIIGLDQYDIDWNKPNVTPQQRWNDFLTQTMGLNDHASFAAAHGKPLSFPEWGLYAAQSTLYAGGGDDPYYVDQMHAWFSSHNTAYQSYFDYNWGGGVMANFPAAQAAYRKDFGSLISPAPPPPKPRRKKT